MLLLRRLWRRGAGRPRLGVPEVLRRAERRRRAGEYAEAGALVARALELDRNSLHAHLLAAYLHVARRERTAASAEFRWVLGRDATHPRALLGLARIAIEDNDVPACQDLLRRALRFYPDFPEAAALLTAVQDQQRAVAPPAAMPPPPPVERLRLPGTGRALVIGRADGGLIVAQPVTEDAKEVAEAAARMLCLAAAAAHRAGLGSLHRAIVDDAADAVFTRTDGELVVSLALPRATDPTQGLLDLNRLWSTARHELRIATVPPVAARPATPAQMRASEPTRRSS